MKNLVHAQTVLLEEDLISLKKKMGVYQTQAALSKAVHYYLENVE